MVIIDQSSDCLSVITFSGVYEPELTDPTQKINASEMFKCVNKVFSKFIEQTKFLSIQFRQMNLNF